MDADSQDIEMQAALLMAPDCGDLVREWKDATPDERLQLKKPFLPRILPVLDSVPDFEIFNGGPFGYWGFVVGNAGRYAKAIIEKFELQKAHGIDEAEIEGLTEFLKLALLYEFLSPHYVATATACRHLFAAINDPIVAENPAILALLQETLVEVQGSHGETPYDSFFWQIKRGAGKAAVSERASKNVGARYTKTREAKAWVASEWLANTDYPGGKSKFAQNQIAKVRERFGVEVTHPTIYRDWLAPAQLNAAKPPQKP